MWNHHESNQKIGQRVQKLKQVHIRTSPDASPENVDVFVGSDSTNSVTAPCLIGVVEGNPWSRGGHTHTQLRNVASRVPYPNRGETPPTRGRGEVELRGDSASLAVVPTDRRDGRLASGHGDSSGAGYAGVWGSGFGAGLPRGLVVFVWKRHMGSSSATDGVLTCLEHVLVSYYFPGE